MKTADEQSRDNDTSLKESLKTAATHELSVLGKTVPTLAVAALLLVGGGSAAVLSSFGTVSGTADVSQAINLGDTANFAFDDGDNDVGETSATTREVNNNADVPANYQFETSGAVTGVDQHIFRNKSHQEAQGFEPASVGRYYKDNSNEWVINISGMSDGSDAIYFDTNFNGVPEFQAGVYNAGAGEPRVKVWKNVDGTYEGDTRFDPAGDKGEFNSDDIETGLTGEYLDKVSGFIGEDYVVLRIDRSELGTSFQYGLKSGFASNDAVRKTKTASDDDVSQAAFIGPQIQSGASHDLSGGGNVSSTYDPREDVIEFVVDSRFGGSSHKGAIYFDSDNDGTADFQLSFQPPSSENFATAWKYEGSQYEEDTAYNRNDDTPKFGDNPETSDRLGELTDVFSGTVNDTHAVVEVEPSELGDKFRYGVKLTDSGGSTLSGYASGDGEFAQVDTSGFAVVSRGDEELSSGSSQNYAFVHDFAINLDPDETYEPTTQVVPLAN